MMDKFFHITERGSNVRTEIIAGVTTFLAMAYILVVNSNMFGELGEGMEGAVYIATAISAVVGTVLIGLLANLPLAQASGMGLNAFFVYTVCFNLGFTYANALLFVLADGILFIILTATGLRKIIFDAIPKPVKVAIPAGIGLFIAFLGFQDAGIVVDNGATLVSLHSFNILDAATWGDIMPLLVTGFTLVLIAVFTKLKSKGAILWSILIGTGIYYLLGLTVPSFYDSFVGSFNSNPFEAFAQFGDKAFLKIFTEGFNFDTYLDGHSVGELVLTFLTTALAFCLVDMFDTMGTLYGACRAGNLLVTNEKGEKEVPNMNRAMLADALATCTGSICGTSTVTTFVESSSGAAAGGRTGFSSMITAFLFLVSMFFAPVASLVPACAYAAGLIFVGVLMIGCVKDIDWTDVSVAVPAFLTITVMPFTYNISYGIAFGIISYIMIKLLTGKIKEINIATIVIGLLFAAMFFFTH